MKQTLFILALLTLLVALPTTAQASLAPMNSAAPVATVQTAPPSFAALLDALTDTLAELLSGATETEGVSECPPELWEFDPDVRLGDCLTDGPLFIPAA